MPSGTTLCDILFTLRSYPKTFHSVGKFEVLDDLWGISIYEKGKTLTSIISGRCVVSGLFVYHFHFPAHLAGGFTLSDLLDKPWS